MKKDAYYFPHFCNARTDRKIKRVIKELGVEGYGIYFMLLEVLREQTGFKYPICDIDLLADEFGTSEQKIRTVISNYQLFEVDEREMFFSSKLVLYLQPYIEKSERARLAANTRWENVKQIQQNDANAYANAEQMQCPSNASKVKESKVKESKVKESKSIVDKPQIPPDIEDVKVYCFERNNNVDAEKWFDFYSSKGWLIGKSKMKDWKAAIRNWEKSTDTQKQSNNVFMDIAREEGLF